MSGRLAIYLAIATSVGVIGAYLVAGGASYEPLEAADPCEMRPVEVLAERDTFEGIALSALDGAACELRVSRETLIAALADEESLREFAQERGLTEDDVDAAARAGLLRAVDDAQRQGRVSETTARALRFAAENLPVSLVLDVFRALPGDPTTADVFRALQQAGIRLQQLQELLEGALDFRLPVPEALRPGFDALDEILPDPAGS